MSLVPRDARGSLVNRIHKLRKDLNFEVIDRIKVKFTSVSELLKGFFRSRDYVTTEILAHL